MNKCDMNLKFSYHSSSFLKMLLHAFLFRIVSLAFEIYGLRSLTLTQIFCFSVTV